MLKIRNINEDRAVEALRKYKIDWLFIVGWSQIARGQVLAAPRKGVIGAHPTLLPIGRGRAAIPWTILKGLNETGVTFFTMDEGVDTGPIIAQSRIPVSTDERATELYQKVERSHAELIVTVLDSICTDALEATAQNESAATFWPGRTDDDGRFDRTMSTGRYRSTRQGNHAPLSGCTHHHRRTASAGVGG